MMKFHVESIVLACAMALPLATFSAPIGWGVATDVSAASDVSTSGNLVEAFNAGADNVPDQTVNGVLFTGTGALLNQNNGADSFSGNTGNAAYNALLSTIDFGGGTDLVSLQIGNGGLVPGSSYEIQVWFADTRYATRQTPFGDGETVPNKVTLDSTPGQYAIGTFIADGTTQTLTLESPGFGNAHINAYQIRTASSAPIATLTAATNRVSAPFTIDVGFTEEVAGLQESDFAVSNGTVTASSLSGSGASYSLEISPAANGHVAVSLPAGSVTDTDGDGNQNPDSNLLTVLHIAPGSEQPSVVLATVSSNVTASFTVDVLFSEAVTGLALGDFSVGNATVSNLTGTGASYSVLVVPAAGGDVTVSLPENVVTDTDGDNLWNTASGELVVVYAEPLTVVIHGSSASDASVFKLYLTFSAAVSGLETNDIAVENGTLLSLTEQGRREFAKRYYIAELGASTPGTVTVSVPAGSVVDDATGLQVNLASDSFAGECTTDFGAQWMVDSAADWTAAMLSNSNMMVTNDYVEPTAANSQFTSILKTFPAKKKALGITFGQSPVWDNWTVIPTVEPSTVNAPVFLPVANDDYYFLDEVKISGATQGYHAWHSTNMVDWTAHGQVTIPIHKWVTTAEYKDGQFYIYVDYPNDHTPHLYLDDDLKDGSPGIFMGMAFNDPTHGSDSAILRDNADGLFHIISEDWSPIKASTHQWDSPLATHASSADGFGGFVPAEHVPPIDFRTTPTGTYGTFTHPHVGGTHISNPLSYEIHTPEQDAFGDWTSIKVGSQYYLFADFDHKEGGTMSCALLTSDSIYEQYELVNDIPSGGHPDPTIGFAEGQFYLITQVDDFTSPGPWVDGVEARVGVDTNGNDVVDQWTIWQPVAEQYDHTPGYARVVTATPAQLDLSGLPEGYGFQFEFRVDDTMVAGATPIMDSAVIDFEPTNFQQWANSNGVPAEIGADNNTNGLSDIIEFTIGQTVVPERQSDGSMTVTAVNEAIDEGIEVELWFADDLLDSWYVATTNTAGVKLLTETVDGAGNHELVFEIFDRNGTNIFWKLVIVFP